MSCIYKGQSDRKVHFQGLGFRSNHWPTALSFSKSREFWFNCFMRSVFRNHTHMILKESVFSTPSLTSLFTTHLYVHVIAWCHPSIFNVFYWLCLLSFYCLFFSCCPLYCFELKLWVYKSHLKSSCLDFLGCFWISSSCFILQNTL